MTGAPEPTGPAIRGLVGVYNAKGTLRGEAVYILNKLIGRAECPLCEITHRGLTRRPDFDRACAGLGVPFELVHLDQRTDDIVEASGGHAPCVLARTDRGLCWLLGRDEIEACSGPDALLRAARAAADAKGLRWSSGL
jgi:hypothetical protein